MQCPVQKRLARRMGMEETGDQSRSVADGPLEMPWWGGSRRQEEARLKLRVLPRAVCVHFVAHCHCLEKWPCSEYQGSWLLSSWENTFHPIFPWHFCAEQPSWEQECGHLDYPMSWALHPLWGRVSSTVVVPGVSGAGCCCVTGISKSSVPPHKSSCDSDRDTQHSYTW